MKNLIARKMKKIHQKIKCIKNMLMMLLLKDQLTIRKLS